VATERQKQAIKAGTPMPDTVEEFLHMLSESNTLKKYISREHAENKAVVEALRRHYERRLKEQDRAIDYLTSEVSTLRNDMNELNDNFNLFMSKLLDQNTERLRLVRQAVAAINRALS